MLGFRSADLVIDSVNNATLYINFAKHSQPASSLGGFFCATGTVVRGRHHQVRHLA